jgi:hypothetical protein
MKERIMEERYRILVMNKESITDKRLNKIRETAEYKL